MTLQLRCACAQVKGTVVPARAYLRATCYCSDCQAYARFLGRPEVLDAHGGTDIVAMAPSGVRITAGQEHLACLSLSRKGLLRWYASCCRAPLGNTPRDASVFYVGMVTSSIDAAPEALDASFGRRDRVAINTDSATGQVPSTPLAFVTGGLRIFANILGARLRREEPTLFFTADGQPLRPVQVLDPQQRAALGLEAA